jgi:hypothetical protein
MGQCARCTQPKFQEKHPPAFDDDGWRKTNTAIEYMFGVFIKRQSLLNMVVFLQ